MSEETSTKQELKEEQQELELLKERATKMGITFHAAIGVEKLKKRIELKLAETAKEPKKASLSDYEKRQMQYTRLRKEANRLIRIRITCMNPDKKNWTGEIMSVSNAVIGTVRKFIPFGLEAGFHVPAVLLKMIKNRQYQQYSQVTLPNGRKTMVSKMLPEFAVEVMQPITKEELDDLAQRQLANHSIT